MQPKHFMLQEIVDVCLRSPSYIEGMYMDLRRKERGNEGLVALVGQPRFPKAVVNCGYWGEEFVLATTPKISDLTIDDIVLVRKFDYGTPQHLMEAALQLTPT